MSDSENSPEHGAKTPKQSVRHARKASAGKELEAALQEAKAHVATLTSQLAKAEAQVAYHEVRFEAFAAARDKELAAERRRVADLSAELLKLTSDLATLLDGRKSMAQAAGPSTAEIIGDALRSALAKARPHLRTLQQLIAGLKRRQAH